MRQYLDHCRQILEQGAVRGDRTGTGTISHFGGQVEYDLSEGFPLMTTKDMRENFPRIVHELAWFLKGDTHLRYLLQNNVNIWTPDAHRVYRQRGGTLSLKEFKQRLREDEQFLNDNGELGPVYGKQWRSWGIEGIDQLSIALDQIKNDPSSRRIIVSAWNVSDLDQMALPPCHVLFQFYVQDGLLSCKLYQRSADMFLGVPFNIASYALLVHLIAHVTGLKPGRFIHTFGDAHIYLNHVEQVQEQLRREPFPLPTLRIDPQLTDLFDFDPVWITLENYKHHGVLRGALSVG